MIAPVLLTRYRFALYKSINLQEPCLINIQSLVLVSLPQVAALAFKPIACVTLRVSSVLFFFFYFPKLHPRPLFSYMTCTHDSYSYKLGQLASSNDEYRVRFQYILGHTLRISYVNRTHDPCSYELEQLASSDDTESYSYTYWVPLQRMGTFATHL